MTKKLSKRYSAEQKEDAIAYMERIEARLDNKDIAPKTRRNLLVGKMLGLIWRDLPLEQSPFTKQYDDKTLLGETVRALEETLEAADALADPAKLNAAIKTGMNNPSVAARTAHLDSRALKMAKSTIQASVSTIVEKGLEDALSRNVNQAVHNIAELITSDEGKGFKNDDLLDALSVCHDEITTLNAAIAKPAPRKKS